MTDGIISNKTVPERVLVAPLDWGLGHATRCIPIIYELLQLNCTVIIAADNATEILLKNEFPRLTFLKLKGYNIQYSRKKSLLPFKIFLQIPSIISTIYYEHRWLKKIVQQHHIDLVISDNRFGLYSNIVPSIYITHQLLIKTGNRFTENIAQKVHFYFIKKFTQCWVPDFETKNNLAGELSHPKYNPDNVQYIGPLSRFQKTTLEKKYDLLILLSGPEPQRSIFESLLLDQLKIFSGTILLVRGLPGKDLVDHQKNIFIKNHLSASELNIAIQQSNLVIARSGYTTIMDLVKLRQKAVLVPTPGQTEQEYLAQYLAEQKIFYTVEQDKFVLQEVLNKVEQGSFSIPLVNMETYKKEIANLVIKTEVV